MSAARPGQKSKSLFQVVYRNGSTFTTTAISPVMAELQATKKRPGPVLKIKFLKKVTNG